MSQLRSSVGTGEVQVALLFLGPSPLRVDGWPSPDLQRSLTFPGLVPAGEWALQALLSAPGYGGFSGFSCLCSLKNTERRLV